MSALLDTALAYTGDGLPVFPLFEPRGGRCSCGAADCGSPGKHPRTPRGLKDASTDEATIRAWWERWPAANIGLVTGTPAGVVAVDVDGLEAAGALAELAAGRDIGGLTVRTGRGWQVWFRTSDETIRNSAGRLGAGIDVRGVGGYVVAPPSLHVSGRRYTFTGGQLEPLPRWLLEQLIAPSEPPPPSPAIAAARSSRPARAALIGDDGRAFGRAVLAGRSAAIRAAAKGSRNRTLFNGSLIVGGYIATGAIDEDEARAELADAAATAGLGQLEAARTIASGFKLGQERPLHVEQEERAS